MAVQTGGIYRNRDEFFKTGKDPGLDADKGSRQWQDPGSIELQDGYSFVAHQDAPDAVAFTQSKTPQKGGGFKYGEKRMIYKKVDTPAPVTPAAPTPEPEAPAPEPEKDKGPVVHSPEVAQAKERVAAFKMDGNAGSTFNTDASAPAEASAAGTTGISFEPAKIDTPAYNPNAGEEAAQGFADKYKLNLMNKGVAGQSDFSGT